MNEIQTGSNQAVHPLPKRDPWASFAIHGAPPKTPHPHAPVAHGGTPGLTGYRGNHRRIGWRGMLAVLGATVLAVGSCGAPAPAAVPPTSPAVVQWTTPKVTPAAQRRIEIVDQIIPASWNVGAAAEWLDRHTASNMVLVPRCSGKAYRCVTVQGGRLPGHTIGWAKGDTITIDTVKVAGSPYRSAVYRKRLLAHELAHTFGLGHAGGRNLMATTIDRMRLSLTAGQRAYLRAR